MKYTNTLRAMFAALAMAPTLSFAQSSPGLVYGQVPTAAQWNGFFSVKQDVLGYTPLNKAGDTMLGPLVTAAPMIQNAKTESLMHISSAEFGETLHGR